MGINISEITKYSNKLLLPNKYKVTMPIGGEDASFNCHTVTIGGKSLATEEWFRHGPIQKIPYQLIVEDFSTTFYVSDSMPENSSFYSWFDAVGTNGIEYYDAIVSNLHIAVMNRNGSITKKIIAEEAFPTGISTVELSYSAEQITDVTVTWACINFS